MPYKILLVSEGLHEGAGSLERLVLRVVPQATSCEWRLIKDSRLRVHRGKGSGLFKRAVGWMRQARDEGFDALVLVVDEDGYPGRIADLDQAQSESTLTGEMPRAMGVAIRTFDAWMLADEGALSEVLGYAVQRQSAPEEHRNPKHECARLRDNAAIDLRQRDMYADVASRIDLQLLEQRCPLGFGIFIGRLRALAG